MLKMFGKYNVENVGDAWDGITKYQLVIVTLFDKKDCMIGRKVFYFLGRPPNFETESQVDTMYNKYPNYSKLIIDDYIIRKVS